MFDGSWAPTAGAVSLPVLSVAAICTAATTARVTGRARTGRRLVGRPFVSHFGDGVSPKAVPAPEAPAFRSTPAPAPLPMPPQDLRKAPSPASAATPALIGRRLTVILGALAIGGLVGGLMLAVLSLNGLSWLEAVMIGLSGLLAAWVGLGFVTAGAGFVLSFGQRPEPPPAARQDVDTRTAILLPTYNEDPGLIFSAVQAIAEDLRRQGPADAYEIFILSDTRDDLLASEEVASLLRTRLRLGVGVGVGPLVHYRRRASNVDRKSGNIAEWVETCGAAFDYMLVLDADSLMTGETIRALKAGMDADPGLGLLQSVPTIVNADTPFARLQQFAARLYGPVFAQGQQWWSASEGNYWGHNAIIRTRAFAESAGLPHLTGPRPFGGHILSHDFVEAALLRRRGWTVRTMASLSGSYEEAPPTLLDMAARDRRWCQGNLQHARLLSAAGLHWVSRMHLFLGVFAYLAPALWLATLILGAIVWPPLRVTRGTARYGEVEGLFWLTLALLIIPKVLALVLALRSADLRRGFGGGLTLVASFLVESLASLLTAPVMMVMQSVAVLDVLIGRDSGWSPQRREGVELGVRDVWRAHGAHVLLGLAGGVGALLVSRYVLLWASPVFLSLALSAILSFHTAKPRLGRALRRRGLLSIPEEHDPPPVLLRSTALRAAYAEEMQDRRRIALLMRRPVPAYETFRSPAPRESELLKVA
jgi:membrane glycosyltransferase